MAAGPRQAGFVAVATVIAALAIGPPLFHGSTYTEVGLYGLYLAVYVVLPGWLTHRGLARAGEDRILEIGMGCTLGLVLQAIAFVSLKIVGAPQLFAAYPLVSLPLFWFGRRGEEKAPPVDPPRPIHLAALVAICAVAAFRAAPLDAHRWWTGLDLDALFHAGNAAELLHHWPLRDPRLAGHPLNYHFLAYACTAGAAQVAGLPMADLALRTATCAIPVLLAIQTYNAARLLGRGHVPGLLAAAVIVMHADLLSEWARILGRDPDGASFDSRLDLGIYRSPPTSFGLVLLATIAILLHAWFESDRRSRMRLVPLMLALGLVASGAKATVMPMVLAGLTGLVLLRLLQRRSISECVLALALLGIASLPMTLWISLGEGSYAGSMFHVVPLSDLRSSVLLSGVRGESPAMWVAILLAPLWLAGFFGLAGLAGFFGWIRARRADEPSHAWALLAALSGILPALALAAPGHSQIFFLYNAQVLLALTGAATIAAWLVPSRWTRLPAALLGWALVIPLISGTSRDIVAELRAAATQPEGPALLAQYREGLAWIRDHTSADALFVADHTRQGGQGGILLSAWAERRVFHETDHYAPERHARRWLEVNGDWVLVAAGAPIFPERIDLQHRAILAPTRATIDEIRALCGHSGEIDLLVDDLQIEGNRQQGWTYRIGPVSPAAPGESASPEIAFANRAMRVLRFHASAP
jgi:hypothetical protein